MATARRVAVVLGVAVLVLFYVNLLRSLPQQHAYVVQENFTLKNQLQHRLPQVEDPLFGTLDVVEAYKALRAKVGELEEDIGAKKLELQRLQKARDTAPTVSPTLAPSSPLAGKSEPLPVLVLCHNRVDYLETTLDNILANRPSAEEFPIIVSQDGTDAAVWALINGPKYHKKVVGIQLHERGPGKTSYHHIAHHFQFAISTALEKLRYSDVIILEDDMMIAPDFFQYFLRARKEVYADESLYTASAWNDNGQGDHGRDAKRLKRSDFFPGLGWLMTGKLWKEWGHRWPEGYWDDWMREPEQRRGRHCLFPEVSRSWTFGERGSSQGQFWKQHIEPVTLYKGPPIPWQSEDLSYLSMVLFLASIRDLS
jgi:hypothetical protein